MSVSLPKSPAPQRLSPDELALVGLLTKTVALPVDVYHQLRDEGGKEQWVLSQTVSPDSGPEEPVFPEAPVDLFEWVGDDLEPIVHSAEDGVTAALRLGKASCFYAALKADAAAGPWIEALLISVAARHRAEATADELLEENESFAMQLASDLEELTFLRSMVDRLASTNGSEELVDMARVTLPVLNGTVRAARLAFLQAPNPIDPFATEVAVSVGDCPINNTTLEQAVRQFGKAAIRHAIVRNWDIDSLPEEVALWESQSQLTGVRSLVIAPLNSGSRMLGWLVAVNRLPREQDGLEASWQLDSNEFGSGEATLMATTASILATHAANLDLLREKEQLMVSMVRALVSAVESKDEYTCGHSERVALFTRRIAEELGYFEHELENIYLSALLHDVGKIGIADAVLKKEGKLTAEEYAEISRHTDEGWAILNELEHLNEVLPGVLHHHERWDGQGYPDGLAGDSIPMDGRVMSVADAYDAMTSDRPYRKGMPSEKAESILREGAGVQWDPRCIDAFVACIDDLRQIKDDYQRRERASRTPRRNEDAALLHEVDGLPEPPSS